jgi:hypothetical protein
MSATAAKLRFFQFLRGDEAVDVQDVQMRGIDKRLEHPGESIEGHAAM